MKISPVAHSPLDAIHGYFHDLLSDSDEPDARLTAEPEMAIPRDPPAVSQTLAAASHFAPLPVCNPQPEAYPKQLKEHDGLAPLAQLLAQVEPLLRQAEVDENVLLAEQSYTVRVDSCQEPRAPTGVMTPRPQISAQAELDSFQALFFDVAGMRFAVPLTALGGIHRFGEVSTLFGQPNWFKGVMIEREQKIKVVDSLQWAMASEVQERAPYRYLIMLGSSDWGLAAHHLVGTQWLSHDMVKWRDLTGAKPWLAGMVKEKMCALLEVPMLEQLLAQGVNISGH